MMMITRFVVALLTVSVVSVSSFEQERDLAHVGSMYKMFQFVCGSLVYRCGRQVAVPQDTACNIRSVQNITGFGTITAAQCSALVAEARKVHTKSQLYKNATLCPNNSRTKRVVVTSYAKYYANGAEGRYCRQKHGCLCCKGAEGFGDPHFITYDGTPYSYHGKCDMVLAQSTEFGNGLGLRVHGRTEIVDTWSRISNAAVQIGTDVIELSNTGSIYFNGVEIKNDSDLPSTMGGLYKIKKQDKSMNNVAKMDLTIDVNEGKGKIKLSLFKKIIAVHVGTMVHDLNGMLGNRAVAGLVGRNDTVVSTANEMGQSWQVTDLEPMMFHEVRAPQYPEMCQLPVVDSRRRLRGLSEQYHRRATEVCAGVTDPNMQKFCVEDVLLTGDADIAKTYFGEAY